MLAGTGRETVPSVRKTHSEASILRINPRGITVVGKGKYGMLYGVQTVCQLAREATDQNQGHVPCLTVRDWPDLKWRCLSPTLTWYSGWNRLEGYDLCNWTEAEWKWLADWSLLHKCNGWAVCMYGYWPFTLPGYPQEMLDVDSFHYNPKTGKKEAWRFTHRNIQSEFYSRVIRYANERGIKVYGYIGKNSFNGCRFKDDPKIYAGGAAELLPFAPGVDEYWEAIVSRILEIGFNGFVFEDPEAYHVPNQNAQCYQTFWQPWAEKYGFKSVADTDRNKPPVGVHIEYYTWLYRRFAGYIRRHSQRLARSADIYLISHILLARVMAESATQEERLRWLRLIDEKHGERVPFIIAESNEAQYVDLLGVERVASLGGRGGSCTNAMRRIASVNNDWLHGGMGGDLAYERDCQKRIVEAGGFGAMGYIFEWTNTEVFGYLAAQHLWKNSGIPGVSNHDQVGILDYSYRIYYGDEVGKLVARAMDEGSDVNDAMVLEGVYGSQYPSTGKALHRDFQLLASLADHAEELAWAAYGLYTGQEPAIDTPAYVPERFQWDGYDPRQDKLFKTERLRRLWLSTRRSQEMCQAACAHRLAQRLIAEGAPAAAVLEQFDRAVECARKNQLIYQINYDDDYDGTDGLCSRVTERMESLRKEFLTGLGSTAGQTAPDLTQPVPPSLRSRAEAPVLFIPWQKLEDVLPPHPGKNTAEVQLETAIGFVAQEDFFRLGVVFTIEVEQENRWRTLFRRTVQRRTVGWENWGIPMPLADSRQPLRLRFITDSYSRAQDRSAPTWKWALWGRPRLVRRSRGGPARVIYDFTDNIQQARAFVRLDSETKDRPFDKPEQDSTGATFKQLGPDRVGASLLNLQKEQGRGWQWLDGFAAWNGSAPNAGEYASCLGSCDSHWAYATGGQVRWITSSAKYRRGAAAVFVGSSDFVASEAELWLDGQRVLGFATGVTQDAHWQSGAVELFYVHGAIIPHNGISGVYVLHVPRLDGHSGEVVGTISADGQTRRRMDHVPCVWGYTATDH